MQVAATAVWFSAVPVKVKGRPAARTTPVACVPAARRSLRVAAAAVIAAEPAEVDYNSSSFSVFPMEACELLGGEACSAQMFPELKLEAPAPAASRRAEQVERDYLAYDEPKTVFLSEACDDLGGEFCDAN